MKQTTRLFLNKLTLTPLSQFRDVSRSPFHHHYSTAATRNPNRGDWNKKYVTLYKRIPALGNPDQSVVPALDQWVRAGNSINDSDLRLIIKDLRRNSRYRHALQVSNWISEKSFVDVTDGDVALHLDLIAKVHGVEEAENYFHGTSTKLRSRHVYGVLLRCFARAKCVEKAEDVLQKMRKIGFSSHPLSYNTMLHLYCRTGNVEKLDALLLEMEANNIECNPCTHRFLVNAYGEAGDISAFEKILTKIETDPEIDIDWITYATAAKHYLDAQLVDKALESLRKSEKLAGLAEKKNEAYSHIFTLYMRAGKKEEVFRVWQECKKFKPTNRQYVSLLTSILKLNDIETAEYIFEEWVGSHQSKDIRILNVLINYCCRNGLMEKAESLLERVKSEKWHKPDSCTWYWMSSGYARNNQMPKAVEAMESALLDVNPRVCWKSKNGTLATCLKYLKNEGEIERLNSILGTLKDKYQIPAKIYEKLVHLVFHEDAIEDCDQVASQETELTRTESPKLADGE